MVVTATCAAACAAACAATRPPRVSPRAPPRDRQAPPTTLLRAGLLVGATGRFALAAADSTAALFAGFVALALGQGTVSALLSSLIAAEAPGKAGYFLGLSEAARALAGVVGPLVSAALFARMGTRAPAAASGLVQAAACAVACVALRAPGAPRADRSPSGDASCPRYRTRASVGDLRSRIGQK